jgi:AraC-like DNA-binding protein
MWALSGRGFNSPQLHKKRTDPSILLFRDNDLVIAGSNAAWSSQVIYTHQEPSCTYLFISNLKLFIKYMVSIRCKMIVRSELEKLGYENFIVDLGEIEIPGEVNMEQRQSMREALLPFGLEVMEDKKAILIEKIKNVIIEMIYYEEVWPRMNFSEYLTSKLQLDYTYLSSLFSEVQGTTIEHFIIAHKIERVKELLLYDELNLTQISYKLNYSSVAHLSNQFKKVTGLTPSFFKKLKDKKRKTLDNV